MPCLQEVESNITVLMIGQWESLYFLANQMISCKSTWLIMNTSGVCAHGWHLAGHEWHEHWVNDMKQEDKIY